MTIEKETREFVEQMAELYFVKRDIGGLLAQMDPETSWLGTGEKEISKNFSDAQQALEKEFAEYGGSFRILEQAFYTSALSDRACVLYGWLKAVAEDGLVEEQNLHLTAVCVKTDQGMKLRHCNISRPDDLQEENHYYVAPQMRVENQVLRGTLENRERWLENLMRQIPGGVHQCLHDPNLTLIGMSDGFLEMFGYTKAEIETRFENKFINMVYPNDRAEMLQVINEQLSKGTTIEAEYRVMSKNDGPVWILDKCRLLEDEDGGTCFYCILIEIAQRKREQEALRLSLEWHRIIMDQATDIIFEWDIAKDTLDFSANWRKKFGYDPIDTKISQRIPLSDNIHPDDMPAFKKIMRNTGAGTPYSEAEFRIKDATGRYWWNRIRATAQFDHSGRSIAAVGVITDISAQKQERLALQEQAQRDALTGLYNKLAIKEQVEKRMKEGTVGGKEVLLIIDVDGFKQVNDTYGHLCGDNLLSDVAEVLKCHFRSNDLIGRIGGDEFLVYLSGVKSEDIVKEKAKLLSGVLAEIRPALEAAPITCSIGAVVSSIGDADYFSLYQSADNALYHRKNNGKDGISFYDPKLCNGNLNYALIHSTISEIIATQH